MNGGEVVDKKIVIDNLKINYKSGNTYMELHDELFLREEYKKLPLLSKTIYCYLSRLINISIWNISNRILEQGLASLDLDTKDVTKRYYDASGEVFCIATNKSLCEYFSSADKTVTKAKNKLVEIGLLEEKTTFNNVNLYYVKDLNKNKAPSIWDIESALSKK